MAQGDSLDEVREKLTAQIMEYVYDATVGPDNKFGAELLSRRAPFRYWVKYYYAATLDYLTRKFGDRRSTQQGVRTVRPFKDVLPLAPVPNH